MYGKYLDVLPEEYHRSLKKNKMWSRIDELYIDVDALHYSGLSIGQKKNKLRAKYGPVADLIIKHIEDSYSTRTWDHLNSLTQ